MAWRRGAGHVELEPDLLAHELAEVGVVRPADRMVEGVSLDRAGLRFAVAGDRLPIAGQDFDADRTLSAQVAAFKYKRAWRT